MKAKARITSCNDGTFVGTALLVERPSSEGVKVVDVFVKARRLTPGKHAVHIHEFGNCTPCTAAGSHCRDLGPHGHDVPVTENHPYHSGDLVNIEIGSRGSGSLSTTTSRSRCRRIPRTDFPGATSSSSTLTAARSSSMRCPTSTAPTRAMLTVPVALASPAGSSGSKTERPLRRERTRQAAKSRAAIEAAVETSSCSRDLACFGG